MTLRAVELFSGSGVVSQALRDQGWEVVSVDTWTHGRYPPIVRADVRHLPLRGPFDFLWASPPCQTYSTFNRRTRTADRELWEATLRAIRALPADRWVIENVRGACATWGIPAARWGPYYLWSNFRIVTPRGEPPRKTEMPTSRARAVIPDPLIRAVLTSLRDDLRSR